MVLDGKYTRLGTIDNVIHRGDYDKKQPVMPFSLSLSYSNPNPEHPSYSELLKYFEISYTMKKNEIQDYYQPLLYKIGMGEIGDGDFPPRVDFSLTLENNTYNLNFKEYPAHRAEIKQMNGLVPEMIVSYHPGNIALTSTLKMKQEIKEYISQNDIELRQIFDTLRYIGPFREFPLRRYTHSDESMEVGTKGENAPHIYETENLDSNLVYILDEQYNDNIYDIDSGYGDNRIFIEYHKKQKEVINAWMAALGFKGLSIEYEKEMFSLQINCSSEQKQFVNIADIGFGFSQVFPIILEGVRMPKHHTLLLEQPEIHLHPKLQMDMADLFLAMALSGKNVIIETHSEHIVDRLVRRILEDYGQYNMKLTDLVGIYWILPECDGAKVKDVEIDEFQGISEWPPGFFDQGINEAEKTFLARMRKLKKIDKHEGDH